MGTNEYEWSGRRVVRVSFRVAVVERTGSDRRAA